MDRCFSEHAVCGWPDNMQDVVRSELALLDFLGCFLVCLACPVLVVRLVGLVAHHVHQVGSQSFHSDRRARRIAIDERKRIAVQQAIRNLRLTKHKRCHVLVRLAVEQLVHRMRHIIARTVRAVAQHLPRHAGKSLRDQSHACVDSRSLHCVVGRNGFASPSPRRDIGLDAAADRLTDRRCVLEHRSWW